MIFTKVAKKYFTNPKSTQKTCNWVLFVDEFVDLKNIIAKL